MIRKEIIYFVCLFAVLFVSQSHSRHNNPIDPYSTPLHTDEISWGVEDVRAPLVWDLGCRGEGILVAILDTGVDYEHPDLMGNVWINPGEDLNGNGIVDSSDYNGIDDDQNGYIDDLRGWNFDLQNNEVMDAHGNGTALAGIIAGDGSGGSSTGVAPEATIMILKNYLAGETGYLQALQYALMMGADVVVSSLTYWWQFDPQPDYAAMRQCMQDALQAGLICVNSIGNVGDQLVNNPIPFNIPSPANCPPPWLHPDQTVMGGLSAVIAVGAYDQNYLLKDYSSVGPSSWFLDDILSLNPNYLWQASWPVAFNDYPYQSGQELGLIKPDLTAPTEVLTTALGGGYLQTYEGTEAAAPHVGGAICLMLSANPYASPENLAEAIMSTAEDRGEPGKDNLWGCGRLDAFAAVAAILAPISGTLTGTVIDSATSEPISDAIIEIPAEGTLTHSDTTGFYLYPGIPEGTHDLRFTADGYDTLWIYDQDFTIGQAETLNVVLTQTVGISDPSNPPNLTTEFRVLQNYPNPFNAETIIPLELPQRSKVKLEIYNVRGQLLGLLYEKTYDAGCPKIHWNASKLPSGVYFYHVNAEGLERGGTFNDVGKMLLLK